MCQNLLQEPICHSGSKLGTTGLLHQHEMCMCQSHAYGFYRIPVWSFPSVETKLGWQSCMSYTILTWVK